MPAALYTFAMEQGETWTRTVTIASRTISDDGNSYVTAPTDVTGWTGSLVVYSPDGTEILSTWSCDPVEGQEATGLFSVTIDAVNTATWVTGNLRYRLSVTDPGGNVTMVLKGTLVVTGPTSP